MKATETPSFSQADENLRILIVEDDRVYSRLAVDVLEGHPRYTANTGQRGLELFQRMQPDITFLDIGLPDANGLDMLAHMKKLYPEAFIVILTASRVVEDVEKARYLGAAGYIVKPFSRGKVRAYLDLYHDYVEQLEKLDTEELAKIYQECFEHADAIQMDFDRHDTPMQLRQREKDTLFRSWRLLYVDDEVENGERVMKRLQQAGCSIEVVNNPHEALEAVSKFHYDMIFISQEMREMSGIKLADELRRAEWWRPIVIITQDKLLPGDSTYTKLKIARFVMRPVKYNTLLAVIGKEIERYLQWQESEYVT